jgi:hypothetical protein
LIYVHISCLLVQAVLLGNHRQVLLASGFRRDLLVRLQLIRLLQHVLTVLHHYVLLVLVGQLSAADPVLAGSLTLLFLSSGLIVHVNFVDVTLFLPSRIGLLIEHKLLWRVLLNLILGSIPGLSHLVLDNLLGTWLPTAFS